MTLSDAFQTLVDLGCEITASNGSLPITSRNASARTTTKISPHARPYTKRARLLDYCPRRRRRPPAGRPELPNGPITVGGGVAR